MRNTPSKVNYSTSIAQKSLMRCKVELVTFLLFNAVSLIEELRYETLLKGIEINVMSRRVLRKNQQALLGIVIGQG